MLIKYFENQNLTIERYRYKQLLFANPGEVPQISMKYLCLPNKQ